MELIIEWKKQFAIFLSIDELSNLYDVVKGLY